MKAIVFVLLIFPNIASASPGACKLALKTSFDQQAESIVGGRWRVAAAQGDHAIWTQLRGYRLLVNQRSIPGRSGLCGLACAINLLQAASVKTGIEPHHDPQALFESVTKLNQQYAGADIATMVTQLRMLLKSHFRDHVPLVSATVLKGLNQDTRLSTEVTSITLKDMKPERNKLKLAMTAQLNASNQMVLQHAQIIESVSDNTINLVEPNAPELDIVAEARGVLGINGLSVPHFFYVGDIRMGELSSFGPSAIITIEVRPID